MINQLVKCKNCGCEYNIIMNDNKPIGRFRCPDCAKPYED